MIEAIGLTCVPRDGERPAVDDLTFEAPPGRVTALLGPPGAGKTTALRLLLQIESGRGVALFDGRPLHRIPHPAREVGVLLGDVPGHPRRTARGHLRMLAAAVGVPAARADEMLDVVGLSGLAEERIGAFSLGMDRRLGLAVALLGDPHTLVLDEPARGLSPREASWLHGLLRGFAGQGGAVLVTVRDAQEAVRVADRVVSIDEGRLLADQDVTEFARTRLRPRVAVASPHAGRLADLLVHEARTAPRERPDGREATPMEVVAESGTRLSVYGSDCAAVGETAYRHGILVHRLAEETGDTGAGEAAALERVDGRAPAPRAARERRGDAPRLHAVRRPGPAAPFLYELRRMMGVRTLWCVLGGALLLGALCGVGGVLTGITPADQGERFRLLTGWPDAAFLPLPPIAAAVGLLGALAYGQEFRYPALAPAHVPVPRRLGLLLAKAFLTGVVAVSASLAVVALNAAVVVFLFGSDSLSSSSGGPSLVHALVATTVWCAALATGCGWAGLLAAGTARSTAVGLAAVLAVPLLVVPMARELVPGSDGQALDGLAGRLEHTLLAPWPSGADGWVPVVVRLVSQPVGQAFAMSVLVLLAAYMLLGLRGRTR